MATLPNIGTLPSVRSQITEYDSVLWPITDKYILAKAFYCEGAKSTNTQQKVELDQT